jgi:hypothetical protein
VKSCACRVFHWLRLSVVLTLAVPVSAGAECIRVTANDLLSRESSEVIFRGTVVQITRTADLGYRATFEVDRVRKGSVSKRFDCGFTNSLRKFHDLKPGTGTLQLPIE